MQPVPVLRLVRVRSDQNTRWRLPFHFLPIKDKNFLVFPISATQRQFCINCVGFLRVAAILFIYTFRVVYNIVARVRRRGENIVFILNLGMYLYLSMWKIWGDKKFLSFIGRKWNGSRHLVFWSLGTLTGLKDRVWGLLA